MKNIARMMFVLAMIGTSLLAVGLLWPAEDPHAALATQILEATGVKGGLVVHIGCGDGRLTAALCPDDGYVVHGLDPDPRSIAAAREHIRSRGLYGQVSVRQWEEKSLPYTDNLVNLVVWEKPGKVSMQEVRRVLAPDGVAYIKLGRRWTKTVKPRPEDIDEWTHYLHGPDGNPVAQDRVVGPPKHYQWTSGPMWQRSHETDSSISTLVTSGGRLFYIVDEAPISLAGDHPLPDKWFLAARDAFNGIPLWKVRIPRWGWREWKDTWFNTRPGDIPLNIQKRLVAAGDRLYATLGYRAPVSELDARTGEVLRTYRGTERTGEILYVDGVLVLSVLTGDQAKVMAVDAATGKQRWVTESAYSGTTVDYVKWTTQYGKTKPPQLDPSLNAATDGNSVAFIDGPDIVCLDFRTGAEKWRSRFPAEEADRRAGGIQSQGNLWIGTMIVHDGVVIHASPNKLGALSADTGELLWTQPKKYIGHLWYEWKDVFVIDGLVWTWSAELDETTFEIGGGRKQRELWPRSVNGYDLKTGALVREVPLGPIFKAHHHHRCYRNKATVRYILASRRGTEYVDLEEGKHTVHNWVRGTCHVGMMPANGLQYAPPHPCVCYIEEKLSGMNALAPEKPGDYRTEKARGAPQAERGSAYGKVQGPGPSEEDWPTFRHDSMRTGSANTLVPDGLAPLWRVRIGRTVSPPIVVSGRLFASLVDEHHVVCLDVRDGSKLWEYAAGGRIDSPPTYYRGSVVFGSADGWVYCLRAADGQLVWRFRAAPEERLIGAFGQLESAWPVHGSVLVQNGTAYFAAGRSSQLDGGIHMYGLDASTGGVLHYANLRGPHYTVDNIEENFRLPLGALPDILMGDGSTIYMRSQAFNAELERKTGKPALQTRSGFLEDSYFKRTPWTFGAGGNYARLIVHDSRSVYYVRMFDSLRGLDPTVFFTPASKGYLLFAKSVQEGRDAWSRRVPVRIRAMALTAGRLLVAGPPDVVDPEDPLGAFEGRKGGLLYVLDSASGEKLAEHPLPFPPVFNGAAAANGRLYIAEEDGSITCFGKQ